MDDDRPRYNHFFRCRSCGTRFHVTRLTADPDKVKTPKCPKKRCAGKVKQSYTPDIGMDVAAGIAPPIVGAVPVRALDMAMEITAQDHGLTDLNDRARVGEHIAPKLEPRLQKLADNFWPDPSKAPQRRRMGKVQLPWAQGAAAPNAQQVWPMATSASVIPAIHTKPAGSSPVPPHVDILQGRGG